MTRMTVLLKWKHFNNSKNGKYETTFTKMNKWTSSRRLGFNDC